MAKPKATVIREMTAANIRSCVGHVFVHYVESADIGFQDAWFAS